MTTVAAHNSPCYAGVDAIFEIIVHFHTPHIFIWAPAHAEAERSGRLGPVPPENEIIIRTRAAREIIERVHEYRAVFVFRIYSADKTPLIPPPRARRGAP